MSRPAKFLVVCLVVGIFLFSYALDLMAVREVAPGREATWVKVRVIEEGSGQKGEISLGLPVALVEMLLGSGRGGPTMDLDGREVNLQEFWIQLRETDSRRPLEFRDDGDRVQVWLE